MKFSNEVFKQLEMDKTYTYRDLTARLQCVSPSAAESTCHAVISRLVRDGKIAKLGYDTYSLSYNLQKLQYAPAYSQSSIELAQLIGKRFPNVTFTIFETILMNEFLNHLIAQNTIFLQIEKESSIYVFRYMQEQGMKNVLYNPSKRDFNLYWEKDCIVITDLISEAPLDANNPHQILLEKMLVDMISDKLISSTFSKAEFPDIICEVQNKYFLDKSKMLRYASRRNRRQLLLNYLEGDTKNVVNR